jgi:Uma2 family endonuclease
MGVTAAPITVAEFLEMSLPEGHKTELIDGEVVTMPMAWYKHEAVKSNFSQDLSVWRASHPIGRVFCEAGFQLDEHNGLIPDVSFVRNERLGPDIQGPMQGAPDVAIEVVSSETAAQLERKVSLYLQHGSKLVVVAYPDQRALRVHRPDGTSRRLVSGDVLEAPDVLPGFSSPIEAFFEGI